MDIPTEYNLRRYERYETVGSVSLSKGTASRGDCRLEF